MDYRTHHAEAVDAMLDQLGAARSEIAQLKAMNGVYEAALLRTVTGSCEHDAMLADLRGLHTPLESGDGQWTCMECQLPSPCRTMLRLIRP